MKASMVLVAVAALAAAGTHTAVAQPIINTPEDATPEQLPAPAVAGTDSLQADAPSVNSIVAMPVKITVVNQSWQAIHTNPQDGWECDLQPGERMDFHSSADVGGAGNRKVVKLTNYPGPVAGQEYQCSVQVFNPSMGYPDMYVTCNDAAGKVVVDFQDTKAHAGDCNPVFDPYGHMYGVFCRESDDDYKAFTYYVKP